MFLVFGIYAAFCYQTLWPYSTILFGNRFDKCYQTMYTKNGYLFGKDAEDSMGLIKGVLKEELGNSLRLKDSYDKELKKRFGGSIVEKRIRGHNIII